MMMMMMRMSCQEQNDQLCEFCKKDETTSPLPARRPYPDYSKLLDFHYLPWRETSTDGREPDDFGLIKRRSTVWTVRPLEGFKISTLSPKT